MEKTRDLGALISKNYRSVYDFCNEYGYRRNIISYLIAAGKVDDEIKKEIFVNAQKKTNICISDIERNEWKRLIIRSGGFTQVSRAIGESPQYLRSIVFIKKWKDDRVINTIKQINDLSL